MITSYVKVQIIICLLLYLLAVESVISYRLMEDKWGNAKMIFLFVMLFIFTNKTIQWQAITRCGLQETVEVNQILSRNSARKLLCLGVPCCAEVYHVSSTPCISKSIAGGWLKNIPLQKDIYDGYKSIVDSVPVLKEKGNNKNLDIIQYMLSRYYSIDTEVIVVDSSEHYEVVFIKTISEE